MYYRNMTSGHLQQSSEFLGIGAGSSNLSLKPPRLWFALAEFLNKDPQTFMDKSSETQPNPTSRRTALLGAMGRAAHDVEATLDSLLPRPHGLHARVHEAMRYATFAG